jgi:hypothetical protein
MNEWNLTPRSKSGFYGKNARNKISEMANYHPDKTKEDLEEEMIAGTDDLDGLVERYEDIDYEKAFIKSLSLSERKRILLFEIVFRKWSQYNLRQLAGRVGRRKLIRIMRYVKNVYPADYNNRVLKRWPNLENFV